MKIRGRLTTEQYKQGILSGDRIILGKAITLVESSLDSDILLAEEVVSSIMPHTGKSFRIGITGVPGAGKSTMIEALGKYLTGIGKKVAVLAVDPSSSITSGSILGDKTRMEQLSQDPNAFIRPSPGGKTLGGIARRTRESILLCEAAGFDILLVETIGVGQSEIKVSSMVDFFLLLVLTGAGDELQAIKKGVLELADAIVINKVEQENKQAALLMRKELTSVFHYLQKEQTNWQVPVLTASAIRKEGIGEIWNTMKQFQESLNKSGEFLKKRSRQNLQWMHETIRELLEDNFYNSEIVKKNIHTVEMDVLSGNKDSVNAARQLLELYRKS